MRAGKLSDAELPSKVVSVVLDCVTVLLLPFPPRNLLYTPLYIHIQYIDCSVDDLDDCLWQDRSVRWNAGFRPKVVSEITTIMGH